MLEQWETEGKQPADRIRSFIHILIANRADIKRYGCPVGTLCSELAKLNHAAQGEANKLFTLFRAWLRRQFTLLGRKAEADAWRCIFSPAARASPRWQMRLMTRNSSGRK